MGKKIEELGVGEIFVNSIDNDGVGNGYDIDLANKIKRNVKIPIIFVEVQAQKKILVN